jgi:hypothetical protein
MENDQVEVLSSAFGSICNHPDLSHLNNLGIDEKKVKIILRENIFTKLDPICVKCMQCTCMKDELGELQCEECNYEQNCLISEKEKCLIILMMHPENRKNISKYDLYKEGHEKCKECPIKGRCESH